jgi:uncharacterized cupredoxin-like copper-binding protein
MMHAMHGASQMRVAADRTTVSHGAVSFVATNMGTITHELIVLPLAAGQRVGTRPLNSEVRVNEDTSVGEASKACGPAEGEGITRGAQGWVTLRLARGRYELVCNIAGHYAAGMHTVLTVT